MGALDLSGVYLGVGDGEAEESGVHFFLGLNAQALSTTALSAFWKEHIEA